MSLKRSAYTVALPSRKISPFSVTSTVSMFYSLPNGENNIRKVLSRRPSCACYSDSPNDFFLMRFSSACCDYVTDGVGRDGSALLRVPELTPDLETGGAMHGRPLQPVGQPVCEQGPPPVVEASRLSGENR